MKGELEGRILDLIDAVETKIKDAKEAGKADKIIRYEGRIEGILDALKVFSGTEGRWEEEFKDIYVCSECNRAQKYTSNYCPECGAKMEKEGNNGRNQNDKH